MNELAVLSLSCSTRDLQFCCGMQTLSYSTWDLVPWPEIEPLGAWSLSHWTTSEVPLENFVCMYLKHLASKQYNKNIIELGYILFNQAFSLKFFSLKLFTFFKIIYAIKNALSLLSK